MCKDKLWLLNVALIELNALLAFSMQHFISSALSHCSLMTVPRNWYRCNLSILVWLIFIWAPIMFSLLIIRNFVLFAFICSLVNKQIWRYTISVDNFLLYLDYCYSNTARKCPPSVNFWNNRCSNNIILLSINMLTFRAAWAYRISTDDYPINTFSNSNP